MENDIVLEILEVALANFQEDIQSGERLVVAIKSQIAALTTQIAQREADLALWAEQAAAINQAIADHLDTKRWQE